MGLCAFPSVSLMCIGTKLLSVKNVMLTGIAEDGATFGNAGRLRARLIKRTYLTVTQQP